jgi:hypothetical protein
MFARGSRAASGKGSIQQTDVRNQVRLHPSPIGKLPTAGSANLIAQEFDDAVVNPIIVRFDNPVLVSVEQSNQASLLDSRSEQFIDARFGSW